MNCQLIKDIIKGPQDRLLCPTHLNNKKNQVFENFLFKCVTRPDLSGVPFIGHFVFIILIKKQADQHIYFQGHLYRQNLQQLHNNFKLKMLLITMI